MKIAVVISAFYPCTDYGGPVSVARGHIKELKSEHRFTILTSNLGSLSKKSFVSSEKIHACEIDGFQVLYYKSRLLFGKFSGLSSINFAFDAIKTIKKFDVVHIHFAREFFPFVSAVACIILNKPYILQTHGMINPKPSIFYKVFDKITAFIMRSAYAVLYLQEVERDRLRTLSSSNLVELMNGIEPSVNSKTSNEILDKDIHNILFLARLHPRKRVELFVRIIKLLKEKGLSINARIVGPDEGDLKNAEKLISELSLDSIITICGSADSRQVIQHYEWADVLLVTSQEEPFPMTVLEAMANSVPVVITTEVQNHSLLNASGSVLLIDDKDMDKAIDEIIDLLLNRKKKLNIINNAQNLINRDLSLVKIAQKLNDIYHMGVS
ncbi:glycosyltransferase [Deinococcus indicus]|nr:glycosyltransferase [Deinococcus indicus]